MDGVDFLGGDVVHKVHSVRSLIPTVLESGVGRAWFFAPGHFARPTMSFLSKLNNSASTALFVFIWSSGAIFTEWGLQHASALMFLILRFTIALAVLTVIGLCPVCLPDLPDPRLLLAPRF